MKRGILWTLFCLILAAVLLPNLQIAEDPVKSLQASNPVLEELYQKVQGQNPLSGRIFIEDEQLSDTEKTDLTATLQKLGYKATTLLPAPMTMTPEASKLWLFLPPTVIHAQLSDENIRKTTEYVKGLLAMPGSSPLLAALRQDPFLLTLALLRPALPKTAQQGTNQAPPKVYQSPSETHFEEIGVLYNKLTTFGERVHFIGTDFFAYENYRAVQDDINFCLVISIPLNFLLFYVFCRRWRFLLFFAAASALSFLTGLGLLRLFYSEIYALVLGFLSTFVGFNNEYMVHLSGLRSEKMRQHIIGLGSAIGTTLIGFVILLAARSPIIKQMALIGIGGMFGFVLFLLSYQKTLAQVHFATWHWRKVTLKPSVLAGIWLAAGAAFAFWGVPALSTKVDAFQYATPLLKSQLTHFEQRGASVGISSLYAVKVEEDPLATYRHLEQDGYLLPQVFHPLALYKDATAQKKAWDMLSSEYAPALKKLNSALKELGVRDFPLQLPSAAPLDGTGYLDLIGRNSPVAPLIKSEQGTYLIAALHDERAHDLAAATPLHPRQHYNSLLTGLSSEMGALFLIGLALMAGYLLPFQRRWDRILYIFAPLVLFAAAVFGYCHIFQKELNIIHVMGFALVISLTLDYTAMALSHEFAAEELTKILLTGLSTIASFGVLCFAKHPILRDLGAAVTGGSVIALAFALLCPLQLKKEPVGKQS